MADPRDWAVIAEQAASVPHMLRIVPHTAPRVGRTYANFSDGFELHLLQWQIKYIRIDGSVLAADRQGLGTERHLIGVHWEINLNRLR